MRAYSPSRSATVVGQPIGYGLEHVAVELKLAVIEPPRKVPDQAVLVFHVRPQVGSNVPQLRPG